MTGTAWIILNIALAIGAVFGTVSAVRNSDSEPLVISEPETKNQNAKPPAQEKHSTPASQLPQRATVSAVDMDDLWQMSLFNPAREESTEAEANAAQTAAAAVNTNVQFELVGIAQISTPGKESAPVAILRSRVQGGRPQNNRFIRPGTAPQQNTTTDSNSKQKGVFAVGEVINDSGYVVKSISPEEKTVEISRAGTVVKLHIDFKDGDAAKRRENAVAEAQKRKESHQQQAKARNQPVTIPALTAAEAQASRTPPSPPAPGSPNNIQRSNTATTGTAQTGNAARPQTAPAANTWSRDGKADGNSEENAANAARSARIQQLLERRRQMQQHNAPAKR